MSVYILISLVAVCAFLPRYLPWLLYSGKALPISVEKLLRSVPASVLAAIVFPTVMTEGHLTTIKQFDYIFVLAVLSIVILTIVTKRMILSSFIGIALFFGVKFILANYI
jgi:branched-subunit amino acid transport protein